MSGVLLAVGRPMPNYTVFPEQGSMFFPNYLGQPFLIFLKDTIPNQEALDFESLVVDLGILSWGKHTSFLVFRADGQTDDWGDSPFATSRAPEDERVRPERSPGTSCFFTLLLIHRPSGIIRAMRSGSISPGFLTALEGCMAQHNINAPDFTFERHEIEVADAYRRFPTPLDMANATRIERMGAPFLKGEGSH